MGFVSLTVTSNTVSLMVSVGFDGHAWLGKRGHGDGVVLGEEVEVEFVAHMGGDSGRQKFETTIGANRDIKRSRRSESRAQQKGKSK